jgi:hypothetical protein
MQLIKTNDILIASTINKQHSDIIDHHFFIVLRATTNTCEFAEVQKRIINTNYQVQEIVPSPDSLIGDEVYRRKINNGTITIHDGFIAVRWCGIPVLQKSLIILN